VFRRRPTRASSPRSFVVYTWVTTAAAVAMVAAVMSSTRWTVDDTGLFWLLSLFVLIGELLPIPVPRRHGLAKVTISTAFAFAMLIRFGLAPAITVYVASVVIADGIERVPTIRILFNAAQYALAMLAAAGVLALLGAQPPMVAITGHEVLAILVAAAAFFAVNHAFACVGAALLAGLPVPRYMRDDLVFQAWTAGCLLAFAPAVVASAHATVALVPLCFVPVLAIYMGGRQAALNSHRAYHDALTELPNRTLLAGTLESSIAVAERERGVVAVLLLDVDDFKAINDTLGHEFGDLVLKRIAHRLRAATGEQTLLSRLGGDEFAVVLDGDHAGAEAVAERLLAALDSPIDIDSLAVQLAASIGIACYPQHGRTVHELLRHADVALYCAKASDTSVQTYAEEYDEYSIDRLALAAQLRRGIERGELTVHYQPKVPLQGGAISSVEALVRWNHPQLGRIGPDGFIPLAEQTGVIKPLTECVLETALAQCEQWGRDGLNVTVSVNVSTRNLLDHDLPSVVRTLLDRFELPASVLELEITESRIVADLRRARAALEELRGMGLRIAIDDFGTGFSSLSQLQQLPVDEIKIDKSFVTRMETDRNDAVLVRSIIELGRNLGLSVTAEGVESESVRRSLHRLGCDFAQGFHIGRPAPAEECRLHLQPPPPVRPLALAATGPRP
jgi:diguanylate cyclase (GGDEF)-like protein